MTTAQLAYSLALLPGDPAQIAYLRERLLSADPMRTGSDSRSTGRIRGKLTEGLWSTLRDVGVDNAHILPVASAPGEV